MIKKYSVLLLTIMQLGAMQPDHRTCMAFLLNSADTPQNIHSSATAPAEELESAGTVPAPKRTRLTINEMITPLQQHELFTCPVNACDFITNSTEALNDHLRKRHCNARRYKCTYPGCSYAAKTKTILKSHARIHDPSIQFKCPVLNCPYIATRPETLKRHLRSKKHRS